MTRVFMWINTVLISMVLGASHTSAQSLTPWSGGTQMPDFNGEIYTIQTAEELAWIASASRTLGACDDTLHTMQIVGGR